MPKAMNYHYYSSWILSLFLVINITSLSSTSMPYSYSEHCDSIVPEPKPSSAQEEDTKTFSLPEFPKAYCIGGSPLFNSSIKSEIYTSFKDVHSYNTNVHGVFEVKAILTLTNMQSHYYGFDNSTCFRRSGVGRRRIRYDPVLKFQLNGFWSEYTGKLCMIGDGSAQSESGKFFKLFAVLELDYVKNLSIVESLRNGTLRSLSPVHDSSYFEPVSIMMVSEMKYEYGLVLKEIQNGEFKGNADILPSLPLMSQPGKELCLIFGSYNQFELIYPNTCDNSAKSCSPFNASVGFLPTFMALNLIECSEDTMRIRILVKFFNTSYDQWYNTNFDPKSALLGEGFWDEKTNQLYIAACKIMDFTNSFANTHVGDCLVRLMLRFPATWSIKVRNTMLGQIWSTKHVNDSEYFENIEFKSVSNRVDGVRGLKYEYTQIEKVMKLCPLPKKDDEKKKEKYPTGYSHDMVFDMLVKNSKGAFGSGFATPLSMGDFFFEFNGYAMSPLSLMNMVPRTKKDYMRERYMNISYSISFDLFDDSMRNNETFSAAANLEVSAEGYYNSETGELCMVGCKKIGSKTSDCEIIVKVQLPSSINNGQNYVNGSIESTRNNKSDPLYFARLEINSFVYNGVVARENIWRMEYEVILVIISNTISCALVVLQLLYVKRNPRTLPFSSIFTHAILSLSYLIPFLLNFLALFFNEDRQNVSLESGKWIKVNEVLVCVITMVGFLLQFRLLKLTWSSKFAEVEIESVVDSEVKSIFYILLPLYGAGNFFTMISSSNFFSTYFKWNVGWFLDGFLLPQILLNMFINSKEKALGFPFYFGTSLVRILPHAYDLFRACTDQNQGRLDRSYIYADHDMDFYSGVWDIVIPFMGLVFVVVIFLQQRFGGRCVLPKSFREVEEYEEVDVFSSL